MVTEVSTSRNAHIGVDCLKDTPRLSAHMDTCHPLDWSILASSRLPSRLPGDELCFPTKRPKLRERLFDLIT